MSYADYRPTRITSRSPMIYSCLLLYVIISCNCTSLLTVILRDCHHPTGIVIIDNKLFLTLCGKSHSIKKKELHITLKIVHINLNGVIMISKAHLFYDVFFIFSLSCICYLYHVCLNVCCYHIFLCFRLWIMDSILLSVRESSAAAD